MMGPLLIEKNFIEAIGSWLNGCGLLEICLYSKISIPRRPESYLNCSGKAGMKQPCYTN